MEITGQLSKITTTAEPLKNQKYKTDKECSFIAVPCSSAELKRARDEAIKLLPNGLAMRSCWLCNSAHWHFLSGKWGKWVLCCFNCGRYFYNKIEITEYDDGVENGNHRPA